MGTPCETFSRARTGPPGPRPLRDASHLYGLPKERLSPAEFEQVRLGAYFALQSLQLATACVDLGVGFAIENPEPFK
eukprot:14302671-Alexandrium_andersonii.AAC.1